MRFAPLCKKLFAFVALTLLVSEIFAQQNGQNKKKLYFSQAKTLEISGRDEVGDSFSLQFTLMVNGGYTFNVAENLYFDIKGGIGYRVPFDSHNEPNRTLLTNIALTFKLDCGGKLINFGLIYTIFPLNIVEVPRRRGDTVHDLTFSLGGSFYFDT